MAGDQGEAGQVQARLAALEALLASSYRLSRTTTTAEAADVVADTACALRQADGAHLYLPEQLGSPVWRNVNSLRTTAAPESLTFDVATDTPDLTACLVSGVDLFVPDALAPDAGRRPLRLRFGMASLLFVPLLDLGVLVLWWNERRDEPPPFPGDWPAFVAHGAQALRRRLVTTTLRDLSVTDPLTGLANRRTLVSALATLRSGACLMLLDLDHFKEVNDSLGHRSGDQVLQDFATELQASVPTALCVSRFGGEEFAVVFPDGERGVAAQAFEDLRAVWRRRGLAFSAGLAEHRERATPEETLEAADRALYRAKQDGRDRLVLAADVAWPDAPAVPAPVDARPDASPGPDDALTLDELDDALARGLVEPHYQPVVDLRSGRVAAVEALARLRHPRTGALLDPARFLPLAERTGRVRLLDRRVADVAVRDVAGWRRTPLLAELSVAVNVSVDHLDDPALPELLLGRCAEHGLPLDALVVEITETLQSVTGRGHEAAAQLLRDAGVNVTLDDFGTGFSSLSYLLRFPVAGIKVDRSFVAALDTDVGQHLVRGVLETGRALDLHVVAEGVETPDQHAWLVRHGCPFAQGYLFSRPVAAAALPDAVARLTSRLALERSPGPRVATA